MRAESLKTKLNAYLVKRGLVRKFDKQLTLFLANSKHPSLHTEILEPKSLRLYSFRIDQKYRAIFILISPDIIEIIDINDHYQ
jgi:plasmid maintenance system killer protein